MSAGHRFEDHTGEVELHVRADTLPEIYAQAGRAVAALLLNGIPAPPADAPAVSVAVEARDPATLLVDWLNEVIFRTEVGHVVFTAFEVAVEPVGEPATAWQLKAEMKGLADPQLAGQVKAATLHQAHVDRAGRGYQARVILDV